MRPVKIVLLFFLLCLLAAALPAQQLTRVPGQLLVRLFDNEQPAGLLEHLGAELPLAQPQWKTRVSESLNIWLLEVADTHETGVLEWLSRQQEVLTVQYNHFLEYRGTATQVIPDDPLYDQQWHHHNTGVAGGTPGADFDSEPAWNITRGGLTPQGDTIVEIGRAHV